MQFANFENPFADTARAFAESVASVMHAESLGFEQVWITEHHFNKFSVSSSIFPLLAHVAARTSRIGLGAGAVLLPFHDPVRVAEDAATVDAISGGRLLLGVGRGGPFPDQFRNFGKNMRTAIRQIPAREGLRPFGEAEPAFDEDALLAKTIVGDPAACIEQCQALQAELGDHEVVLLLRPASYDPEVNRRSLTLFAEQVRPHLG